MFFRHFFDEKLAHYSYLVGCQQTGEAIVIDPARHVNPYFRVAEKEGLHIIAATETHIHADFVSGARELALRHDAKLYLSDEGDQDWKYQYLNEVHHERLKDGSSFSIGYVDFEVLHTPGHTPESLSFLLTDKGDGLKVPMGIFTGDFVFVGDVGRPDLLEKAANISGSAKVGAQQMFESLKRFKHLPDFLQVWPAHGAGSACGKSLGAVPMSTVGYEKIHNWALQQTDKEVFVKELIDEQPEPPKYFATMKQVNKNGPELVNSDPVPEIDSIEKLEQAIDDDHSVVLDVRAAYEFGERHLPGSINIPFNQSFPNWAGWLLEYDKKIIVLSGEDQVNDIKISLQSIGFDQLEGYAKPDMIDKASKTESYEQIDPEELHQRLNSDTVHLLDVRNQNEWNQGHINGAQHIMLGKLKDRLDEVSSDKKVVLQCQSGGRSAIAASVLQANGIKNVINLKGGYGAWLKQNLPIAQ